ncbi:MAG: hypothetical protein JNK05_31285 [Myxococcales bacterium]|nr:hypothetical protein [Myxococcales bacterium]
MGTRRERSAATAPPERSTAQVLRDGSARELTELFERYAVDRSNTRWGAANPFESLAGPIRVKAIRALRGPAGPKGRYHHAALAALMDLAKPKDLSLLVSLARRDPSLVTDVWAFTVASASDGALETHADLVAWVRDTLREASGDTARVSLVASAVRSIRWPDLQRELASFVDRAALWDRLPILAILVTHDPDRWTSEARAAFASVENTSNDPLEPAQLYARWQLSEAIERLQTRDPTTDTATITGAEWLSAFDAKKEPLESLAERMPDDRSAHVALLERLSTDPDPLRVLEALSLSPWRNTKLLDAVWPWTLSDDPALAVCAMRLALASGGDQTAFKLNRRLRDEISRGDASRVVCSLEALADETDPALLPALIAAGDDRVLDAAMRAATALVEYWPTQKRRALFATLSLDALAPEQAQRVRATVLGDEEVSRRAPR